MTWWAIKDTKFGRFVTDSVSDRSKMKAWEFFADNSGIWETIIGHRDATGCTLPEAAKAVGESIGYRCVEVQLVEPIPVHVKCDQPGCGWHENTTADAVAQWFRKPCPKCGAGEIIDGDDLSTLCTIIGLHVMGLGKIIPSGTGKPGDLHIDTGALRSTAPTGGAESKEAGK